MDSGEAPALLQEAVNRSPLVAGEGRKECRWRRRAERTLAELRLSPQCLLPPPAKCLRIGVMQEKPGWRIELERSLKDNDSDPASRYLQLATRDESGAPTVRTLVFRRFLDEGLPGLPAEALVMCTDARSGKARSLRAAGGSAKAEAVFYVAASREQFRVSGTLSLLEGSETAGLKGEVWSSLSAAARQSFTWPEPGMPREGPTAFALAAPGPAAEPPPAFALILLDPIEIDHLELRPSPHRRTRYQRNQAGRWESMALNP